MPKLSQLSRRRSDRAKPTSPTTALHITHPDSNPDASPDFYDVPLPQPTTHAFALYDLVLCQYDHYPLWPALIYPSAYDGSHRKYLQPDLDLFLDFTASSGSPSQTSPSSSSAKSKSQLRSSPITGNPYQNRNSQNSSPSSSFSSKTEHQSHKPSEPVESYHVMFPNDHSTAWVRADLIVKFHPDISSYVQVSAMSCEYASEQNIALDDAIKYYHDKLMNQAPASVLPPNPFPARNSPQSDAYKRGVVRLLGQWMLLTFNEFESPSLIVSGRFKYLDMVADGRKLPPVLRDNLAPFRYWPKKTVVPVHPDGIVSKILPRLATQSQRKAIGKKKKKKKSSSMNTSLSVSTRRRVSPRRRAKTLASRTLNR